MSVQEENQFCKVLCRSWRTGGVKGENTLLFMYYTRGGIRKLSGMFRVFVVAFVCLCVLYFMLGIGGR